MVFSNNFLSVCSRAFNIYFYLLTLLQIYTTLIQVRYRNFTPNPSIPSYPFLYYYCYIYITFIDVTNPSIFCYNFYFYVYKRNWEEKGEQLYSYKVCYIYLFIYHFSFFSSVPVGLSYYLVLFLYSQGRTSTLWLGARWRKGPHDHTHQEFNLFNLELEGMRSGNCLPFLVRQVSFSESWGERMPHLLGYTHPE